MLLLVLITRPWRTLEFAILQRHLSMVRLHGFLVSLSSRWVISFYSNQERLLLRQLLSIKSCSVGYVWSFPFVSWLPSAQEFRTFSEEDLFLSGSSLCQLHRGRSELCSGRRHVSSALGIFGGLRRIFSGEHIKEERRFRRLLIIFF